MTDDEIYKLLSNEKTKEKGFSILVGQLKEKVYWQIRRMVFLHEDTDDLVQEVFIKVYQNIGSFKRDAALSTWVYRIAMNHTINFLQSQKRKNIIHFSSLNKTLLDNLKQNISCDENDIEFKLQKALLSLPTKQREVFNLRYYDELPFKEMSSIMGTTESALKASYHFAAKKIQKKLLEEDDVKIRLTD